MICCLDCAVLERQAVVDFTCCNDLYCFVNVSSEGDFWIVCPPCFEYVGDCEYLALSRGSFDVFVFCRHLKNFIVKVCNKIKTKIV